MTRGMTVCLGMDYKDEMYVEHALLYSRVEALAKAGIWETKDGKKIRVEDMTDSHIRNTIALLKRHNVCDLWMPWIARLEKELERRADGR